MDTPDESYKLTRAQANLLVALCKRQIRDAKKDDVRAAELQALYDPIVDALTWPAARPELAPLGYDGEPLEPQALPPRRKPASFDGSKGPEGLLIREVPEPPNKLIVVTDEEGLRDYVDLPRVTMEDAKRLVEASAGETSEIADAKADVAACEIRRGKLWKASYAPSQLTAIVRSLSSGVLVSTISRQLGIGPNLIRNAQCNRSADIAACRKSEDTDAWCVSFLADLLARPGAREAEAAYQARLQTAKAASKTTISENEPKPAASPDRSPEAWDTSATATPIADFQGLRAENAFRDPDETVGPWKHATMKPSQVIAIVFGSVRGMTPLALSNNLDVQATMAEILTIVSSEERRIAYLKDHHTDADLAAFRKTIRAEWEAHRASIDGRVK